MSGKRAPKQAVPVSEADVEKLVTGLADVQVSQTNIVSDVEVSRKAVMKLEHNFKLLKKAYCDHMGDQCPEFITKMDVRPVISNVQEAVPVKAKKEQQKKVPAQRTAVAEHAAVIIGDTDEDDPETTTAEPRKKKATVAATKVKATKAVKQTKKQKQSTTKATEARQPTTTTAKDGEQMKGARRTTTTKRPHEAEDADDDGIKKKVKTAEDEDDDKHSTGSSQQSESAEPLPQPQPPKAIRSKRPKVDYSIVLSSSDEVGRYTHPMKDIEDGVCLMYNEAQCVPFDANVIKTQMRIVFDMYKVSKATQLSKEDLAQAVCEFVAHMFNTELDHFADQRPLFLEDDLQLATEGPLRNPVNYISAQPEPFRSILMKMVAMWKLLKSDIVEPYELTCILAACLRKINDFLITLRHGHPAADAKADKAGDDGAESSDDEEVPSETEQQSNEDDDEENDENEDNDD